MWSLVCCTAASGVTFWATKWLFSATVVRSFPLLGMLEQARRALGGILLSLVRTKTQVQGQLILTRVQGKTRGMWPPVMNGPPVLKKAKEWCPIKWQSQRGAVNMWCYLSVLQLEGTLPTQTKSQISDLIYTSGSAKPDRVVHSRTAAEILVFNQMSTSM